MARSFPDVSIVDMARDLGTVVDGGERDWRARLRRVLIFDFHRPRAPADKLFRLRLAAAAVGLR
jgi:hypothetical protein